MSFEVIRCLLRVFLLFCWDKRQTFICCLWLRGCSVFIYHGMKVALIWYWVSISDRITVSDIIMYGSHLLVRSLSRSKHLWPYCMTGCRAESCIYTEYIALTEYIFNWFYKDDAFHMVMLSKRIYQVFPQMIVSYRQILKVKYLYRNKIVHQSIPKPQLEINGLFQLCEAVLIF